jgi:hypothetical protein
VFVRLSCQSYACLASEQHKSIRLTQSMLLSRSLSLTHSPSGPMVSVRSHEYFICMLTCCLSVSPHSVCKCRSSQCLTPLTFLSPSLVRRYSVQALGSTTSMIFSSRAFPLECSYGYGMGRGEEGWFVR